MAQFARPVSTVSAGNWTPVGGPSTLWECLDEVSPNDATDYATVFSNFTAEAKEVGLSAVTDPAVSTGHILRVRLLDDSGIPGEFTVYLKEGASIRASFLAGTAVWATESYTLSGAEADSIGNYGGLSVEVVYLGFATAGHDTWIEFEVPNAGGTPPVITAQPQPTAADESATAHFSVTATGATSYQWQRAERYSETFADIGGATASSYTTGTLTQAADHLARYRVNVTNADGTTTSSGALLSVGVEGNFALNDSAPDALLLEFAAAASAQAWGWFGLPAAGEGSLFETAASPWSFDFSLVSDYYMWTAQSPPVGGGMPPMMMLMGVG